MLQLYIEEEEGEVTKQKIVYHMRWNITKYM